MPLSTFFSFPPSTFLSLPTELLEQIADCVPAEARKNLRSTCWQMRSLLIPCIIHTIYIDIGEGAEITQSQLEALADPESISHRAAVDFTKKLVFSFQTYRAPSLPLLECQLEDAITKLGKVEIVNIFAPSPPIDWVTECLPRALAKLPLLNDVEIDFPSRMGTLLHPSFVTAETRQNLKRLVVRTNIHALAPMQALVDSMVTADMPNLRKLEIATGPNPETPVDPRSTSPFKNCPRLTSLSLCGFAVRAVALETAIPHLKHLRSLTLCPAKRALTSRDMVGLDRFWELLAENQIWLRDLRACTGRAQMDYMGSYSGIEKLEVANDDLVSTEKKDISIEDLYDVLRRHRSTLKELVILAGQNLSWSYGPELSAVIQECPKLQVLNLDVPPGQVSSLLREAGSLPALREVVLDCTRPGLDSSPAERDAQVRRVRMEIECYTVPASSTLFQLRMRFGGGEVFRRVPSSDGGERLAVGGKDCSQNDIWREVNAEDGEHVNMKGFVVKRKVFKADMPGWNRDFGGGGPKAGNRSEWRAFEPFGPYV